MTVPDAGPSRDPRDELVARLADARASAEAARVALRDAIAEQRDPSALQELRRMWDDARRQETLADQLVLAIRPARALRAGKQPGPGS